MKLFHSSLPVTLAVLLPAFFTNTMIANGQDVRTMTYVATAAFHHAENVVDWAPLTTQKQPVKITLSKDKEKIKVQFPGGVSDNYKKLSLSAPEAKYYKNAVDAFSLLGVYTQETGDFKGYYFPVYQDSTGSLLFLTIDAPNDLWGLVYFSGRNNHPFKKYTRKKDFVN
ncbi:hypothetical protein [Filimonas effusa]|uniref:Uncharacterized protein n=1 Tax=Filimonas effusa TaxID=2508721 RepID=A0A4Q1DCP5_9BACT|nr:hypothetical protein [Filimonas effusa]RXK86625.1 hypothetical protein ESB13_07425 [Filimonas effusa]